MSKANLKVPNAKPYWTVIFPVYGGKAGENFLDEWRAYKFAAENRPSKVTVFADGLPPKDVAEFYLEPEWLNG